MPRQARAIVPHYPHHFLQRGPDKQGVFAEKEDYEYYLNNLWEARRLLGRTNQKTENKSVPFFFYFDFHPGFTHVCDQGLSDLILFFLG